MREGEEERRRLRTWDVCDAETNGPQGPALQGAPRETLPPGPLQSDSVQGSAPRRWGVVQWIFRKTGLALGRRTLKGEHPGHRPFFGSDQSTSSRLESWRDLVYPRPFLSPSATTPSRTPHLLAAPFAHAGPSLCVPAATSSLPPPIAASVRQRRRVIHSSAPSCPRSKASPSPSSVPGTALRGRKA